MVVGPCAQGVDGGSWLLVQPATKSRNDGRSRVDQSRRKNTGDGVLEVGRKNTSGGVLGIGWDETLANNAGVMFTCNESPERRGPVHTIFETAQEVGKSGPDDGVHPGAIFAYRLL